MKQLILKMIGFSRYSHLYHRGLVVLTFILNLLIVGALNKTIPFMKEEFNWVAAIAVTAITWVILKFWQSKFKKGWATASDIYTVFTSILMICAIYPVLAKWLYGFIIDSFDYTWASLILISIDIVV